jgi:drug/metabolite transporter (DMT)-like permease
MNRQIKYALFVFIGACSYGLLSTIIKLSYEEGFEFADIINSQYFFGWLLLGLIMLFSSSEKVTKKQFILLSVFGTTTSLTGIFYYLSLQVIPASIAVVLLFQFTWIGIVIEAVVDRRFPTINKISSAIIIFIGTLLAGNLFSSSIDELDTLGVGYGLLAALAFALFIFVSGKVEINLPPIQRSFFMTSGALVLLLILFSPSFLYNGSLTSGLWKYGLMLGIFGVVFPVVFYAIGAPKINTGLGTILGAGELPVTVIASVIILKEAVTYLQWVGIVIIFAGIGVAQIKQLKVPT